MTIKANRPGRTGLGSGVRIKQRRATAEDIEIGQKMRALRLQRGLSQQELGRAVGVTFQQVQKYERGANRVSAGRLARIADALAVPVTFFYRSAEPSERRAETGFAYLRNKKALRLARAYAAIRHAPARNVLVALAELLERKPRAG